MGTLSNQGGQSKLNVNSKHKLDDFPYLDVAAIFSLAVMPDLVNSFMASTSTGGTTSTLNPLLYLLIVRSVQVSLPILLIMKLRNVDWQRYGFRGFRPIGDILVAVGLAAIGYIAYYVCACSLLLAGFDFSTDTDALPRMTQDAHFSVGALCLVFVSSCANGFAEELAIRSYLITRLNELSGSKIVAAIVTTTLFAAYHSYQGRYGIVSAMAIGSVFAIYFITAKRFWPIAIAHAILDFIPLTMLLTHVEAQ